MVARIDRPRFPGFSQQERMEKVLQMLETRDSLHVAELAETFSVSEVTVRSDLSTLANQGLVARVRGGVRALQHGQPEVGFDLRLRLDVERKRAIGRAAAEMVDEGEAVALDASTTAYYLALELRKKRELVVVTNGLLVATALADAPGITVLVTGGMLRLSAMSLVGDLGTDVLRTTRINKGFLGARGLSLERGLMDLNPDEVRIKQEMADACEQVFGILDGTKWHRSALLAFVRHPATRRHRHRLERAARRSRGLAGGGRRRHHCRPGPREPPPVRPRDLRRASSKRRALRLMIAMAAVDLGAQSGRVALGRFDGAAARGDGDHRFANVPLQAGKSLQLGRPRVSTRTPSTVFGPAHGRRSSTRSQSTPGQSTSGSSTASGRLLGNPVHYRDPRRASGVESVLVTRSAA